MSLAGGKKKKESNTIYIYIYICGCKKASMQNAQKQRENESCEILGVSQLGMLLGSSTSTSIAVSDAAADLQRI